MSRVAEALSLGRVARPCSSHVYEVALARADDELCCSGRCDRNTFACK
jgi:hypothetical protein